MLSQGKNDGEAVADFFEDQGGKSELGEPSETFSDAEMQITRELTKCQCLGAHEP